MPSSLTHGACIGIVLTGAAGCSDDVASSSTTMGSGGTGSDTTSMSTSFDTAVDTTDGFDDGLLDCEPPEIIVEPLGDPISVELDNAIIPGQVCPSLAGDFPELFFPSLRIIRPATVTGGWPEPKLPVIVFSPGAGQDHREYDHLFEPLAGDGFVSVLVETSRVGQDENLTRHTRASVLACTLRWLASQWSEREHLSCDLVLAGHSRGGGAAYLTAGNLATLPWEDLDPQGIDLELRALVSIAGAASADDVFPGEPVAFLGLMGATDEDPVGQLVLQYDRVIPDEVVAANPDDLPPKYMLLPYDVPHNAWGGGVGLLGALPPTLTSAEYRAKAEAIWLAHAPPFLRWRVLGQDAAAARDRLVGADVPASLDQPQWWAHIQPAYAELSNTTVMPRTYTADTTVGSSMRLVLDDFESGGAFDATGFTGIAAVGPAATMVAVHGWQGLANHRSHALLVEWGSDPQAPGRRGGALEWGLELDASGFQYLSLRVGQLPRGMMGIPPMGLPCELSVPSPGDPDQPDLSDAVSIGVSLSDGDGSASQTIGPVVQQELRRVVQHTGNSSITKCVVVDVLPTLRVPLSDFGGVDLASLQGLSLEFEAGDGLGAVLIDAIELTTG